MKFIRELAVPFPFLAGSSSLVLGEKDNVTGYFMGVFKRYYLGDDAIYSACTYPTEWAEQNGVPYLIERTDEGLLSPDEIFEAAGRECRGLGSKIIYVPGITRPAVKSYGAQYKFNFDFLFEGGHWSDLPNWLTEYAIYANSFSKQWKCDIFLNLDWNLPVKELPSLFLNTFDRIFEYGEIGGEKAIYQTRDIKRRADLKASARGRHSESHGLNDW